MKSWTNLVLLLAVLAVFLGIARTEETADDFRVAALENVHSDAEDEKQLYVCSLIFFMYSFFLTIHLF